VQLALSALTLSGVVSAAAASEGALDATDSRATAAAVSAGDGLWDLSARALALFGKGQRVAQFIQQTNGRDDEAVSRELLQVAHLESKSSGVAAGRGELKLDAPGS
jgi:hypothetical protein